MEYYYYVSMIQWDGFYPSAIFKSNVEIKNDFVVVNYNGYNRMARICHQVSKPSFGCKEIIKEIIIED